MAETNPIVVNPPTPAINWVAIVASILAAVLAGMKGEQVINTPPKPPTPIVVPNQQPIQVVPVNPNPQPIQVVPVNPQPNTNPIQVVPNTNPPIVPVQPPVNPPTPSNNVRIVDAKGNVISGTIDTGRLFMVKADIGIVLTPVMVDQADAEVMEISPNQLAITLQKECVLQIVVSGAGKPTIIAVKSNKAPQPPPVVPVVVNPPVVPPIVPPVVNPPILSSGPFTIGVIEDSPNRPKWFAKMLGHTALWDKYRATGNKVRIWNAGEHPSTETEAVQDIQAVTAKGATLPAVVIRNAAGAIVAVASSPQDDAAFDSLMAQNGVK